MASTTLLLRPEEVAEALGLSRSLVYQLLASGEIPSIKVGGRTRRVARADLEAYVERLVAKQSKR